MDMQPSLWLGHHNYVPAMEFHSAFSTDFPSLVELGAPKLTDSDGILDGGSLDNNTTAFSVTTKGTTAGATTIADYESECAFGRNLVVKTATGTTARAISIHGRDYLGQYMTETITTSATTSAVVYGKKAFKYIDSITAAKASGAITVDIGWGNKLGLPVKPLRVINTIENGVNVGVVEDNKSVTVAATGLEATTGTATIVAPIDGYILAIEGYVTTAVTTAAVTMDCVINGTGTSDGDFIVPVAAVGVHFGGRLVTPVAVNAGDTIVWTSDGGSDAGAAAVTAVFGKLVASIDAPDLTDPATATTGDPRGLLQPVLTFDGSKTVSVVMVGDNYVNADGNGGLHGVPHYTA